MLVFCFFFHCAKEKEALKLPSVKELGENFKGVIQLKMFHPLKDRNDPEITCSA